MITLHIYDDSELVARLTFPNIAAAVRLGRWVVRGYSRLWFCIYTPVNVIGDTTRVDMLRPSNREWVSL